MNHPLPNTSPARASNKASGRVSRHSIQSMSHPYAARVANVDDAQRLKELHRAAVQVSSLDAFGQVLDEEPE